MPVMSNKLRVLLSVTLVGLAADQLTKYWVELNLPEGESVRVLDGFLFLTHARNPGAAFGLFASTEGDVRLLAFSVVSIIAMLVIALFFLRLAPGDRVQSLGLSLVLAGAAGNFIDRVWRGEVIDLLHVRVWGGYAWPDFNLADVFIVLGVASLMVDLLSREAASRAG